MRVCNVFSLGMVRGSGSLRWTELTSGQAGRILHGKEIESYVGHADHARLMSSDVGFEIAHSRRQLALGPGDVLLVGQYDGPRLPEGASSLPEGATIRWVLVTVG